MFAYANPGEWWLEIAPTIQQESWQRSCSFNAGMGQWNAYLNQICITTLLDWFQSDDATAAVTLQAPEPLIWEWVNGTAIAIGNTRVIILPSEGIDCSELEVPQEWVDLPAWAADYYLAVQIHLTDADAPTPAEPAPSWIRVWGYTTHADLKTLGQYDSGDRTYCLDAHRLNRDLSTLGVTLQFCANESVRVAIPPVAELAVAQAEHLLQRLGTPALTLPRLAVPFALWGALLEGEDWRRQLYHLRTEHLQTGQPEPLKPLAKTVVNLRHWVQHQATMGWQSLEAAFGPDRQVAVNYRSAATPEAGAGTGPITQVKSIELATELQRQTVILLMEVSIEADERAAIVVQLHPTPDQPTVPAQLILTLLSDTGEPLQTVQSGEQDDYIQLRRFRCPGGTQFTIQISWGRCVVQESFQV